ncbi:hypothetical protein KIL84_004616 [Mauremys mutica]|uniref:Uncharacterized protein n=1 Tax=Mauremys mutica TaxID=74926 RepID=A0A9D3XM35_9SAUR|nr:hypothetical protein KIL84_004616 [Mauremys mutica]
MFREYFPEPLSPHAMKTPWGVCVKIFTGAPPLGWGDGICKSHASLVMVFGVEIMQFPSIPTDNSSEGALANHCNEQPEPTSTQPTNHPVSHNLGYQLIRGSWRSRGWDPCSCLGWTLQPLKKPLTARGALITAQCPQATARAGSRHQPSKQVLGAANGKHNHTWNEFAIFPITIVTPADADARAKGKERD